MDSSGSGPERLRLYFATEQLALNDRHWTILWLVALAALIGVYDLALLQLALPQIAQSLKIPLTELSNVGAVIKLGSLPAIGFALAADQWGRRRLLIISFLIFTLSTGASALAPTTTVFVICQFGVRLFATVVAILAGVFIVEEFPAHARGWGMGTYTALSTVGGGVAALLFALVEVLPFGWRGLYLIGFLPILVLPLWIAHLPETTRFQAQKRSLISSGTGVSSTGASSTKIPTPSPSQWPLWQLFHAHPGRLLLLAGVILLFNLGGDAALFYDPTYLQQEHGWLPWHISLLNLSAGFMAVLGSMAAGRMSDGMGRKRTSLLFLTTMPLFVIAYYNSAGWLLPLFWAGLLFSSVGATVVLNATSGELFPTAYRATALGLTTVLATVSGASSLAVHGQLVRMGSTPWVAITLLVLLLFFIPIFLVPLPETSGRSLEEIAPEQR